MGPPGCSNRRPRLKLLFKSFCGESSSPPDRKQKDRRIPWMMGLALLCALPFAMVSCRSERAPSILVIALDRLPYNPSLCSRDHVAPHSGFKRLCNESVRFTHAITPSLLTAPAAASLLTGLYPLEHGVHHNGRPGLSSNVRTAAEAALKQRYRTSFFSGGAPLVRRMGLHQGFEVFDDNFTVGANKIYRTFGESVELFTNWWNSEVNGEPFFSVIYGPDLAFRALSRPVRDSEYIEQSDDAFMDEIDENLGELFARLDEWGQWNDTYVVVTGLNGQRDNAIDFSKLEGDLLQVELFIKPSQKPRDAGIHWKVDRNVSLVDVGLTLFDILKAPPPPKPAGFQKISLLETVRLNRVPKTEETVIPVETGWNEWMGDGALRVGAYYNHQLIWLSKPPMVFNTLVDTPDTVPSRLPRSLEFVLDYFTEYPVEYFPASRRRLDVDDSHWLAQTALEKRNWTDLEKIAVKAQNHDWLLVARKNLNKSAPIGDPCLLVLAYQLWNSAKNCRDENLLQLVFLMKGAKEERDVYRKRILKMLENEAWELKVYRQNAALGYPWFPSSIESKVPSLLSLAMGLPEVRKAWVE